MTTSTVMPFSDFQKTRRFCSDLPKATSLGDEDVAKTGFTYLGTPEEPGSLYIEILDEKTEEKYRANGSFHLIVERHSEVSFDLTRLERQLYDFALAATYIDPPKPSPDRFALTAEVVDDALNAALVVIQDHLGVTDGGIAALYFSGDEERADFADVMQAYADCEKSHDHPEDESEGE